MGVSFISAFNFNGVNIKLAGYHNYPYDALIRGPDGNYTYTGSSLQVGQWLAKRLNFTLTVVTVSDEDAKKANISNIDLVLSKVINKELDGTCSSFIATPERAEKMEYTFMVWTEPYNLIVPVPQPTNRLFAFIRPFQPIVWMSLFLAAVGLIAIMSWFSLVYDNQITEFFYRPGNLDDIEKRTNESQKSVQHVGKIEKVSNILGFYGVYVINILTNHGSYSPYVQDSFRILVGCWLLAALVLVNSYSSIVVSSLTVPLQNKPVNSFEDLANSNDVFLLFRTDVVLGKLILEATSGVFKTLADKTLPYPDRLFKSDVGPIFKKLEQGQYAYTSIINFNRFYVSSLYKSKGKCRFLLSDPLQMSTGYFGLLLQKNSPYKDGFSFELTRLWETGLTRLWIQKQIPYVDQCTVANAKRTAKVVGQSKIQLDDLTSAFFVLGAGLGLATLSFFVEVIQPLFSKKNKK